jgi:hypothetical protein
MFGHNPDLDLIKQVKQVAKGGAGAGVSESNLADFIQPGMEFCCRFAVFSAHNTHGLNW